MHCVSGLGRAPIMLAYLMVKYCDINNIESIVKIRKKIKGSINSKQLEWIQYYDFYNDSQCCNII
jgi:protein tyrosine phosphatase type 4A